MPNPLKNLGEIKIYRSIKSLFPLNHSTSGPDDNIIVLYDSVFNFGLKRALAHEMAHILYSHLDKNDKKEYQSILKLNEVAKDCFYNFKNKIFRIRWHDWTRKRFRQKYREYY